jgi:hypothetical protein
MTGAYLFAVRDGKKIPIEVEHLTDDERTEKLKKRNKKEIMQWLNLVCKTLSEIENKYFVRQEK